MTRIALLGPASSIHLQRWAEALVARRHVVCVISQHPCEREILPKRAQVIWLPHTGERGYFRNVPALRHALRRFRPQILNTHYASGYGTTACFSGFSPNLLSVWGSDVYDFPYEGTVKNRLVRLNLQRATAIASTSEAMARQVQRLAPAIDEIAVTPFGVDIGRFAPDPSKRDPAQLTVGMVKTLAPKYGVDLLLHAFAELLREESLASIAHRCRLEIVGDGPQRGELEALATQLGIAGRVRFVGAVPHAEVPDWLNRFDLFVAPSRLDSESFGAAVVEASACGLAVVVSDAGGLPEVVYHGETGLVVPRDDVSALRGAMLQLLLDPALRERLGADGREWVVDHYEWSHCVDLMEACYERLKAPIEHR